MTKNQFPIRPLRLVALASLAAWTMAAVTVANDAPHKALARQILEATGTRGGLVVHLGCGDGRLTAALGAGEGFLVHGLDAEKVNVGKARGHIRSLGLYGKVSAEHFTGEVLPYAENLVNLLVAEDLGKVSMDEVMRVLAPRGVAYIKKNGKWTKTAKPWPDAMDEWTHWRHGADGNMVSQDRLIGPPRRVQWVDGPLWQRHHAMVPSITTMVSAAGRVFAVADEAPMGIVGMPDQWRLVARDAFNGVVLWKRPIADWGSQAWSYWTEGHSARFNHPIHVRKRLVAMGDRLYVTLGFNAPVTALDAATGQTRMTYEGTQYTDEFVVREGVLYLSVNDRPQKPWPGQGVLPQPSKIEEESEKRITAVDAATGNVLWMSGPLVGKQAKPDRMGSMKHLSHIACEKGVFLVDRRDVVCLDLATGRERWRTPRLALAGEETTKGRSDLGGLYHNLNRVDMQSVVYYRGLLLVLHSKGHSGFKWQSDSILQALDPATGKELWQHGSTPINYLDVPDVLGAQGLVWIPDRQQQTLVGLDPATGEPRRSHSIRKVLDVGHHHRCYPNRGTENFLVLARRGAEFVDLQTGEITLHHWARSGCRFGHLLANGLLYKLPDYCRCYVTSEPRGLYALAAGSEGRGEKSEEREAKGEERLQRGPAWGEAPVHPSSFLLHPSDWPTYRHDPMRSGHATCDVPAKLTRRWQAELSGKLSAPVAAGGKVFVAAIDAHTVHALDAETGKSLWRFTAGGRIDSPPTIHQGTAIFGSADGWVYCVRSSDGAPVWRFRAAPAQRRITAFGQLESAWPVSGSVLVADGKVFCAAGRASLLDGGVYAYALDAATGKLLEELHLHETQTDTKTTGQLPEGALQDILATDGQSVYLCARKLDFSTPLGPAAGQDPKQLRPHLVAQGGFLDRQWFHRASWSLAGKAVGNLIVFDEQAAYAASSSRQGNNNRTFYVPAGGRTDRIIGGKGVSGPSWLTDLNVQHGGYLLSARELQPSQQTRRTKGKGTTWHLDEFPVCPWAMVAAGDVLLVAGFVDRIDPDDPWGAIEGRRGGVLCILSTADGTKLAEYPLESPPIWDGLAAAGGQLYLSTRAGTVLCFGEK